MSVVRLNGLLTRVSLFYLSFLQPAEVQQVAAPHFALPLH